MSHSKYAFNSLKQESTARRSVLNKSRGCAVYAERCPHGVGRGKRPRISLKPESYLSSYPGSKSQGIKQLMAGGGVATIGLVLVPLLSGLF